MKLQNNIGWCDATTNAVTGCDKVSPGCKNCYAESGTRARVLRSQGKETWGAKGERVLVSFEPVFRRLNKLCVCDKCSEAAPLTELKKCHWNKTVETLAINPKSKKWVVVNRHEEPCGGNFRRIRLFADSNSDCLDRKWLVDTLARLLDAIRLAPNVDVLLLTKRIELWRERVEAVITTIESPEAFAAAWGNEDEQDRQTELYEWLSEWVANKPPANVWLGVSVEDQKRADERIPLLLQTPATVRFLSVEPLLEKVDLKLDGILNSDIETPRGFIASPGVDWVIVGGESGKSRRRCGVEAIVSVAQQCVAAGVPVYVKQDCAFQAGQQGRIPEAVWKRKEFPQMKELEKLVTLCKTCHRL